MEDFRKEQDETEKQKKPEECVLSDRQICENIHYFYYDIKSDFLNQFIFEILEDVIMEDEMKKLGRHQESREARDIYSDSDYEDKRDNKEESIEEKEICEEQSKDNLTPEGGDVCDLGDHESNDKDKEELVPKQGEENCEAESKENSTGIIHELDDGEGIREELVCNMTAQEQKESVIKEKKAKEESGAQYKELLTRQSFLCMGLI